MIMRYIYIYKHCLRSTHQQPTTTVSSSCLWRHFHVITGSGRVTLCHNSQQTWVTAVSIACGQAFRQAYFFACNHPTVPSKDCLQTGWSQGVSPPFSVMSNHKRDILGFCIASPLPYKPNIPRTFMNFGALKSSTSQPVVMWPSRWADFSHHLRNAEKKQQPEVLIRPWLLYK